MTRGTKRLIWAATALVLAWVAGLVGFATAIPDAVHDTATPSDAIVVLTGGSDRVATGFTLLRDGLGGALFVSGVHASVTAPALIEQNGGLPDNLAKRVEIGHVALDTVGNAAEVANWVRKNDFRSLRLVTASYHMPRSLMEMRHALPEVGIIPHPVFPTNVRQADWWRWQGTTMLIATEFSKYMLARLRLFIIDLTDADRASQAAPPPSTPTPTSDTPAR